MVLAVCNEFKSALNNLELQAKDAHLGVMRAIIDKLGDVRIVGSKKGHGGKGIMKRWRGRGENVFHPSWAGHL